MSQKRREKEAKQKTTVAEDSDKPAESKKVSSDKKEDSAEKENSDSKGESSESKEGNSEAKAEGEEAAINLRPLTMEDLRQAKNQVSCCPDLHRLQVIHHEQVVTEPLSDDCRLRRASRPRAP